jgi:glutamate-1-semialdehyde 2,1-aminomutase
MSQSNRANSTLDDVLAEVEARYHARHPGSAAHHAEAVCHMPGGNTRTVLHFSPFPLVWASGTANRLSDVDGNSYLDLLGEYSAGLYGHSNPVIGEAVKSAIDGGTVLGGPNRFEAELASAIRRRFPSIDLLRFTNSGTEANLLALCAVLAQRPGRSRVLAFKFAYHGSVLAFAQSKGPLNVPMDWLMGSYNDVAGTEALIRTHASELAAVIVEPMQGGGGCIPATTDFLRMLRNECTAHGIALIFDEVMTSRLSPGGLQGQYGVSPDMTTLGKYLGGGASFGAFGGRRALMQCFDPTRPGSLAHAGTFNNNVMSMAGGLAGLTKVFTAGECIRINRLGDQLRTRVNEAADRAGVPLQATGVGSLVGIHFARKQIKTPEDANSAEETVTRVRKELYKLMHLDMIDRGYYFARRGFIALSLPMTEADIDGFIGALDDFLGNHGALIDRALPFGC